MDSPKEDVRRDLPIGGKKKLYNTVIWYCWFAGVAEWFRRWAADPLYVGSIPTPGSSVLERSNLYLVIIEVGGVMTEKAVEETFAALFVLTDLRQIFRDTKPTYQFNSEQKRQIREIIEKVRQSLDVIEKELMK